MNDFEGLSEESDSHLFLTVLLVVTNHDLVDESLDKGALNLLESLLLIFSSSVRNVHLSLGSLNIAVINKGLLGASNSIVGPLSEEEAVKKQRVVLNPLLLARHFSVKRTAAHMDKECPSQVVAGSIPAGGREELV